MGPQISRLGRRVIKALIDRNIRVIARLDIKGPNLIKGIHLEGLRVVGKPNDYAIRYYNQGIDELVFMDSVASLYGRNHLGGILKAAAENIFVPITVGGGVRSVEDALDLLHCGADKIAVNTAAVDNPSLITQISTALGSQAMVISIEAKRAEGDTWEVFTDNGREATGIDVIDWAVEAVTLGAGEILLTSVDREGTRRGFDVELVKAVTDRVTVPVIASGGMGGPQDLVRVVTEANADAVAMADILHFNRSNLAEIRKVAKSAGLKVREYAE